MGVDLPAPGGPAGVDGHDDALGAELVGPLGHDLGGGHRPGVERHLVGPGPQEPPHVVGVAHTAPHREGDEDLLGGAGHDVDDGVAGVGAGGDVEEDELVGTFGVVAGRQLDGVAGVAQTDEVHALDDAAGVDVEAGDHTGAKHRSASSTVKRPS